MHFSQLLSIVFCLISLTFIVLILGAGSKKNVLSDLFFLKTDTGALNVPATLSNSTYLKDISNLTGNDLVGPSLSASSLGLAKVYTISLFTACAKDLGGAGVRDIASYGSASVFLALAYVLAFVFTFLTTIFTLLFSSRARWAALTAVTTAFLAMVFLLAASAAALGIFSGVKKSLNSNLEHIGVSTTFGNVMFIVSWLAAIPLVATCILLSRNYRKSPREGRHGESAESQIIILWGGFECLACLTYPFMSAKIKSLGNKILDLASLNGERGTGPAAGGGLKKFGLLQSMPTWRRHNYNQIEKQPGVKTSITGDLFNASDRDILLTRGFGGEDDIAGEEEHEFVHSGANGIQLQSMGRGTKDIDIAYEPYRSQAVEGSL